MTKFLLIRHATTDSVGKRLSGRTPGVFLNEEGRAQAQNLAKRVASLPIKAVYSSPLERAVETARPIAEMLHLKTTISNDFLEIDFGEWTNRLFDELHKDVQFQRFNSFRSGTRITGGEAMHEAQARIITGLQKLCVQHPNEAVAVVSHSDLIKAAIAYYAGIHLDLFQRIEVSPASVTIIEMYNETPRLMLINHTGNLTL